MADADMVPRFASSLLVDALADTPVVLIQSTFVLQELRRQASWQDVPVEFFHFRDKDGAEVDGVLERVASAVAGIDVKASATGTPSDFCGMRKLKAATGDRFAAGVVLYDGENVVGFGDGLFAVPIRALWEGGRGR